MSLEDAGIPAGALEDECLGPVTRLNRRLYVVVILILGAVLIVGVSGWLILAANAKAMPDGLSVVLGTVAGALVALVSDQTKR